MLSLNPRILLALGIGMLIYSCSPKTSKSNTGSNYSEDLSVHRPKLAINETSDTDGQESSPAVESYPKPSHHIKTELDSVVSLSTYYNDQKNYVEGYTIQVYTGTSRDDANKAQLQIYSVLGQASPWVDYRQPVYKVKVGKYYSKLEANKLFRQLKKKFPNALLIPQRFKL